MAGLRDSEGSTWIASIVQTVRFVLESSLTKGDASKLEL